MAYDRVAAAVHWLVALLVIVIICLGLFGEGLEKVLPFSPIGLHKSLGMSVFVLTLFRIAWRLGHRPPPLPATMPKWQVGASHAAHFLLFALMLGLPITGYLFGSGGPYPMQFFGLDVPKLAVGKALADATHELHEVGGYSIACLVLLHIAAAVYHQLVQKDGLINRMRPWLAG